MHSVGAFYQILFEVRCIVLMRVIQFCQRMVDGFVNDMIVTYIRFG